MKPPPKKPAKARKEPEGELHLPDSAGWKLLVEDQKLNADQARALDHTLHDVVLAISTHRAKVKKRGTMKEIVQARLRLCKALDRVILEVERGKRFGGDYLPEVALYALGEMISDSAVEDAIGKKPSPIDLAHMPRPPGLGHAATLSVASRLNANIGLGAAKMEAAVENAGNLVRIADVERHFKFIRGSQGLKHGPQLLHHFARRVRDPVAAWLDLNRRNKGGTGVNAVRWIMITALANYAETSLKIRVTSTANGKFHRLCAGVFHAMNLPERGLEEAIERIVTERRKVKLAGTG
jgi:hypothetical protein